MHNQSICIKIVIEEDGVTARGFAFKTLNGAWPAPHHFVVPSYNYLINGYTPHTPNIYHIVQIINPLSLYISLIYTKCVMTLKSQQLLYK